MDLKVLSALVASLALIGALQSIEAVEPIVLHTENGSMNVEVALNTETLEPPTADQLHGQVS